MQGGWLQCELCCVLQTINHYVTEGIYEQHADQ